MSDGTHTFTPFLRWHCQGCAEEFQNLPSASALLQCPFCWSRSFSTERPAVTSHAIGGGPVLVAGG